MSAPSREQRLRVRSRPSAPIVMYQQWRDLIFLHWEWSAEEIQTTLPPGLYADRHDGRCYLGVVPFKMRAIRPRFVPPVPFLSNFLELNLRTYVHDDHGLPGVWFFSLDANRSLAVAVARRFFHLPYHRATMKVTGNGDRLEYTSSRAGDPATLGSYRCRVRGAVHHASPGSLEFFLLERYVLFADAPGGLRHGQVHHVPYPLRDVELLGWDEPLFPLNGFTAPGRAPDHAIMSPGVKVSIHPTRPV